MAAPTNTTSIRKLLIYRNDTIQNWLVGPDSSHHPAQQSSRVMARPAGGWLLAPRKADAPSLGIFALVDVYVGESGGG
jgi:hypothetical protein